MHVAYTRTRARAHTHSEFMSTDSFNRMKQSIFHHRAFILFHTSVTWLLEDFTTIYRHRVQLLCVCARATVRSVCIVLCISVLMHIALQKWSIQANFSSIYLSVRCTNTQFTSNFVWRGIEKFVMISRVVVHYVFLSAGWHRGIGIIIYKMKLVVVRRRWRWWWWHCLRFNVLIVEDFWDFVNDACTFTLKQTNVWMQQSNCIERKKIRAHDSLSLSLGAIQMVDLYTALDLSASIVLKDIGNVRNGWIH